MKYSGHRQYLERLLCCLVGRPPGYWVIASPDLAGCVEALTDVDTFEDTLPLLASRVSLEGVGEAVAYLFYDERALYGDFPLDPIRPLIAMGETCRAGLVVPVAGGVAAVAEPGPAPEMGPAAPTRRLRVRQGLTPPKHAAAPLHGLPGGGTATPRVGSDAGSSGAGSSAAKPPLPPPAYTGARMVAGPRADVGEHAVVMKVLFCCAVHDQLDLPQLAWAELACRRVQLAEVKHAGGFTMKKQLNDKKGVGSELFDDARLYLGPAATCGLLCVAPELEAWVGRELANVYQAMKDRLKALEEQKALRGRKE